MGDVILAEQSIAFADDGTGVYGAVIEPPVYTLAEGETYTVRWDGVDYICACFSALLNNITWEVIGNPAVMGGEDTGEPFAIASVAMGDAAEASYNAMIAADTADSHTVGIVLGATEPVIFPEQTLEFLTENGYGQWVAFPAPFVLVAGETYRVVLDGTTYVLPCEVVDGMPTVTNIEDLNSTTQPEGAFSLCYLPAEFAEDGTDGAALQLVDSTNAPTHTLAVYQTAAVSNDVITENWDGSTEVHPGVESVSLQTEDGGEKQFILEDLVAEPVEVTVELDFSGGDMVVTPQAGQAFSSIVIPKPDNLIPDNIAADKDVAGIIGTLIAGSDGGSAKYFFTSISTSTETNVAVNHDLGATPDVVLVFLDGNVSNGYAQLYFGISSALYQKLGSNAKNVQNLALGMKFSSYYKVLGSAPIDSSSNNGIHDANSSRITIGCSALPLQKSTPYRIIAISGLT